MGKNTIFGEWKFCFLLLLLCAASCKEAGREQASCQNGAEIELRHSRLLDIRDNGGFKTAWIRNPWDTTLWLQKLALIEKGKPLPEGHEDHLVIRIPVERTVIFSSVHASLFSELRALNAIKGICDARYITDKKVREGIADKTISDCGTVMNPQTEKIISLRPDAVFLSPYDDGAETSKLNHSGLNTVLCADYMESSPLGRAEWMRFYGMLLGKGSYADSLFSETERQYISLKKMVARKSGKRPKVIFDRIYGQGWDMPGGKSTLNVLAADAGGDNPFGHNQHPGRMPLNPEIVFDKAGDADFWLIRYTGENLSMKSLGEENPLYSHFKAYESGEVYGSDTVESNIFDDTAFHPHWLLADLINIFHPEIGTEPMEGHSYFHKLK